jgi:hypothetical protein
MARRTLTLLALVAIASCTKSPSRTPPPPKDFGLTFEDGGADMSMMMSTNDGPMMTVYDFAGVEAGSVYGDLATDRDASGCLPGQMGTACPNAIPINGGCGPVGSEICGNGIDDDCDGYVDSYPPGDPRTCTCAPGDVQRCFNGPPAKRGVGACTDGYQTCIGSEFGTWGPCTGGIGPAPEVCNKLDDDCDGCVDDGLCCGGIGIECPAPGDPRIAPVGPFTDLALKGELFFPMGGVTWTWTVSGGPCDQLFASSDFTPASTPPAQSFTLTNANAQDATVHFTLSGDYTVTLTVIDNKGEKFQCTWVQHVIGPGVRFELCWDHQGTVGQGGSDLDLHVHRSGTTTSWFVAPGSVYIGPCNGHNGKCPRGATCTTGSMGMGCYVPSTNPDDCHWANCAAGEYFTDAAGTTFPNIYPNQAPPSWGYASGMPDTNCSGSKYGYLWDMLGYCHNPRLDLDNILSVAAPENTNLDNPVNGDSFRAMVHYYGRADYTACAVCPTGTMCDPGGSGVCVYSNSNMFTPGGTYVKYEQASVASTSTNPQHPIVNIYCGGTLKATYGQKPDQVQGFDWGTATVGGEMWRVADVTAVVNSSGMTTDCTVKALHAPGATGGYWVTPRTNTDNSY